MNSPAPSRVDLSPAQWPAGERDRYLRAQAAVRDKAGAATGRGGAVAVSYNAFAARAGLEAIKQGGTAIDAAMTAALCQVALTAGAPISAFGIMSLVYYEAASGAVHTMNAEWNTVLGETDPLSIPGAISFGSEASLAGTTPSGRTALVGGFMKGVEAAHRRFGALPFAALFAPAIEIAEQGMPVTPMLARFFAFRPADLARLPATAATFLRSDGAIFEEGEIFRQPALAATLRAIAAHGADHMYGGAWGQRLVEAVRAEGGAMSLEDLRRYQVAWSQPLAAPIGGGFTVAVNPPPNAGGVGLIEAQNLALASGLAGGPHWSTSAKALRDAVEITQQFMVSFLGDEALEAVYPGLDFSPAARATEGHAKSLWARMAGGAKLARFKPGVPRHSDDVVAIDRAGNIAAITHSINCVLWGKTGIVVDGITIGDPASFQQAAIARAGPGARLPSPTETGILFKDRQPVVGFASMGSGLHQRTFQCLLNFIHFGMSIAEANDAPDFFMPFTDGETGELTLTVPAGRFDPAVLDATGWAWRELSVAESRLGGAGDFVAISRDPASGDLEATSPNRNNGAAVAF